MRITVIFLTLFFINSIHSEIVTENRGTLNGVYFKATKDGVYLREFVGEPIKLFKWEDIETDKLKHGEPDLFITYQKVKSSGDQVGFYLDKKGKALEKQPSNDQATNSVKRKFLLKGINGQIVYVDGIVKVTPKLAEVEVHDGWGFTDIPWGYVDLDYLQNNEKVLYDAYQKAKNEGTTLNLKWGSASISSNNKTRKFTFKKGSGFSELKNCKLVSNPSNDGDSFHVKVDGEEHVFRLYFVDTTESSMGFPDRVNTQANYFKISPREAVKLGKYATDFTRRLIGKKPFTVYTKWEDAMGGANTKRNYAFVLCDNGRFLSEMLAENGLVRVFGMPTKTPNGISPASWKNHLKKLEKSSKLNKLGGWGYK